MPTAVPPGGTPGGSDPVVDWCLRNAGRMERLQEFEQAARWCYVAAGTAAEFGGAFLSSAPLEAALQRLALRVDPGVPAEGTGAQDRARRWLHVFTATAAIGGHTALARRWIQAGASADRHSVVATFQSAGAVEPKLAAAAQRTGGEVRSIAGEPGLVPRASRLRALAAGLADVVVLHVHPWDVVPVLAFGTPGGPPVLLMNHADHAFWVGAGIADLVVDIRDSGLALSRALRGVRRSALLPVRLEDHGPAPRDRGAAAARLRDRTLHEATAVLLTIGSRHKYQPVPRLDFPAALRAVVDALPGSRVIAVGPDAGDPVWRALHEDTGGRVTAVGPDPDLAAWHAAADLYLESFPIGSYTALLEVALAGRAFVRKPLLAPEAVLPVDRGALASFDPPVSPADWTATAIALAGDARRREAMAARARASVLAIHCSEGWASALEALVAALPAGHRLDARPAPAPTPHALVDYWTRFHRARSRQSPLDYARAAAAEQGLRARVDAALVDEAGRTA